ncbi:CheY-like chemotaxis protein [Variovorax paradoxus]|nr:CheY-like chemotaxis protein [Variovorax paradoxus]
MTIPRWIFVDDQADAANAFASRLSNETGLDVVVFAPAEAKAKILTGQDAPDGVLMDVDLSAAVGETGTGPGIAQDIRIKQKSRDIQEFPVIRFAAIGPVERNIKGDPASDDLFDLKIQKESLLKDTEEVVAQLHGLLEIYRGLKEAKTEDVQTLPMLVGLSLEDWELLGHLGFESRLLSAIQSAPHVAAGTLMRDFLLPAGLLITEDLLAVRLGVDVSASGTSWDEVKAKLPFFYSGIGGKRFVRWWARGLEAWWLEATRESRPLSNLTPPERVERLNQICAVKGLVPLQMPIGSAGSRPWRLCSLMGEREPKETMAIDPLESVRLMPRTDLPPWVDPLYAALGPALQQGKDFRLNQTDLTRLSRKHK